MSIRISAMFDDPDTADIALMNLRSNGIEFHNVSQQNEGPLDDDRMNIHFVPVFGFPQVMNGIGVGLYPFTSEVHNEDRILKDALSSESKLEIDVDDEYADLAKKILTSSHGYRIVS